MTNKQELLTHKELLENIRYDPETGKWFWLKARSSNKVKVGDEAGCVRSTKKGKRLQRYIVINSLQFLASRLAWFYMTGEWPLHTVDHEDNNSLNDKWSNLQDITYTEQNRKRRLLKIPASGFHGVTKAGGRFHAYLQMSQERKYLGSFETGEEASKTHEAAKEAYRKGELP